MANYDNKLDEWFKQVERQEQALKAKKTGGDQDIPEEPKSTIEEAPVTPQIRTMEIEGPVREAPASVVTRVETASVVADTALAVDDGPKLTRQPEESAATLFDDDELPPVEDFFSFLNRAAEQPVVEEVEEHVFELPKEQPKDQPSLNLSEGTGEPRPLTTGPIPPKPIDLPKIQSRVEMPLPPKPTPAPKPIAEEPVVERIAAEKPVVEQLPEPADADSAAQANWDRVPHHLQTLFGSTNQEIAQNSYKAFKETREELIQRLLDPTVSLEEAARILNVCPTTVRRYTNRGVLQHYRTAGNQRRFKLSDVLVFMEKGQRGGPTVEKAGETE